MKRLLPPVLTGVLAAGLSIPAAAAVSDLLPGLTSDDIGVRDQAEKALFREAAEAGHPDAGAERIAYCEALCAALADNPPVLAAHALVRQLQYIGHAESVPTLVELMEHDDAHLREAARMALAANPSSDAGYALVDSLRKAKDPRMVTGLIDALGTRRQPRVVPIVSDAMNDPQYARAAAAALAQLGTAPAAKGLFQGRTPGDTSFRTGALLDLAAEARRTGNKKIAARVYRVLMSDEEAETVRAAAITGYLTLAESSSKVAMRYLSDPSEILQAAVVEAASQVDSPRLHRQVVRRLPKVAPELQLRILTMAARTGAPASEAFIAPLLKAQDTAIASAAADALAVVGTRDSIPALMEAQAVDALSRMRSRGVTDAIASLAADGDVDTRATAIRVLANRSGAAGTFRLVDFARDPDDDVARAALTALRDVAPASALGDIIELLVAEDSSTRARLATEAAVATLRRSPDPEASIAVVAGALDGSGADAQSMIYKVLVQAGSDAALAPVVRAAQADGGSRASALRALTAWRAPNAVAPLLELAADANLDIKNHALIIRGVTRLLGSAKTVDLEACARGLEVARRPDEKKLLLGAVGRSDSPDALALLAPYLSDPDVQAEATAARDAVQERIDKKK